MKCTKKMEGPVKKQTRYWYEERAQEIYREQCAMDEAFRAYIAARKAEGWALLAIVTAVFILFTLTAAW